MKYFKYTLLLALMITLSGCSIFTLGQSSKDTPEIVLEGENPGSFGCDTDFYSDDQDLFRADHFFNIRTEIIYLSNSQFVTDPINSSNVTLVMDSLNSKFNGANARFNLKNLKAHVDDDWYTFLKTKQSSKAYYDKFKEDVAPTLRKLDRLTIVVVPSSGNTTAGIADGIPSNVVMIQEKFFNQYGVAILIHEIGHCLGLYHTHTQDSSGKKHSYEGGDYICSTAAFPKIIFNFIGEDGNKIDELTELTDVEYEILRDNFMSYSDLDKMTKFTSDQIARMRKKLQEDWLLRKIYE